MTSQSDGMAQRAAEFVAGSVADATGKAARRIAETPVLAGNNLLASYGVDGA